MNAVAIMQKQDHDAEHPQQLAGLFGLSRNSSRLLMWI